MFYREIGIAFLRDKFYEQYNYRSYCNNTLTHYKLLYSIDHLVDMSNLIYKVLQECLHFNMGDLFN